MVGQINGSSRNVSKRIIVPRKDDPEKVKYIYKEIDGIILLCSHVDDVGNYLGAISTNDDSTISTLNPVTNAFKFVSSEAKQQMNKMRSCMDNTKSKKMVTVVHSKNNKLVHQRMKDQLAQS